MRYYIDLRDWETGFPDFNEWVDQTGAQVYLSPDRYNTSYKYMFEFQNEQDFVAFTLRFKKKPPRPDDYFSMGAGGEGYF